MEKTIYIDNKPVLLRSSGSSTKRYKAQFGRDFLRDILKLNILNSDITNLTTEQLDSVDFDVLQDIVWVFAKTANPQFVQDPLTWLDSFDEFPVMDIFVEVIDLVIACLSKKN